MTERLVLVAKGSVPEMRALAAHCETEGLEVALRRCSGRSWGAQLELLVQEPMAVRFKQIVDAQWRSTLEREGLAPPASAPAEGDDPPCPACGTAAPLVDGACSECGLQLG